MAKMHEFKNYLELTRAQKEAMVRMLSYEHVDPSLPVRPIEHFDYPVALLKNGKVIAALVTNGKQKVYNWAGIPDNQFYREFGVTPAEEILRQHLKRIGKKNLTYLYPMIPEAGRAFERRLLEKGVGIPARRKNSYEIVIPPALRAQLQPKLPYNKRVWRMPFRLR